MRNSKTTEFDGLAEVISTEAFIFRPIEQTDSEQQCLHVDMAVWDTGAQLTIVSPRIVEQLNLRPIGKGIVMGIGGDGQGNVYSIDLGLPNGKIIHNLYAISYDIDDYDILIGMDVISLTDFLITNKDNTVFSFRYPSEGGVEL